MRDISMLCAARRAICRVFGSGFSMNDLVFLASRMPLPPGQGNDDRAWRMLCHLATTHRVHLGCFFTRSSDQNHLAALNEICASVICLPFSPAASSLKKVAALVRGKPVSSGYFGNP